MSTEEQSIARANWPRIHQGLGLGGQYFAYARVNPSAFAPQPKVCMVPMIEGVGYEVVINELRKRGVKVFVEPPFHECDLDEIIVENDRHPKGGSYVARFVLSLNQSATREKVSTFTLLDDPTKEIACLERLVWDLGHFDMTGELFDQRDYTPCRGSRYSDGSVPRLSSLGPRLLHIGVCQLDGTDTDFGNLAMIG